ncbi:N-6 DNA Methylase [Saccharicrinis carchari]|uniref:site-specific DNA-methyltransferase (adenine-specific) n=1 Tax=Saccharicrinis carchari TaxID=1168039 RepID=A0A521B537_SACCC|nr:type I restriction-modification system subunit M N-terminal domain-containing protein [Saccharicrinis carchari]SMO42207.1 N-6 DNA Methylase [Saccharicrinis carchari]
MHNVKEAANFIWAIADLLRGDYKQSDYGKVILPLTVLRRLDCVLAKTKPEVLKKFAQVESMNIQNIDPILNKVAGCNFNNRSLYDFDKLVADPNNIASNLRNYINGFSEVAREIIEQFDFDNQITKLDDNNLLFMVLKRFQELDLHPDTVSSMEMGYMFEELIRKFSEISNETAGLPAKSDGSFLFLMNLISKMKPEGSRLAIVFNGSPLFSGAPSAKKNESSIRQWIIENDLLKAVIALPNLLFQKPQV